MEIETLKRSYLKRNMVIVLLVIAIISTIILTFTKAKYKNTESIPLVNGTINYKVPDFNTLAIYIENEEGNYVSENKIPLSGYYINEEKSYCQTNDNKDSSVKMKYENGSLTISNVTQKTKCYFYFNLQEKASNLKDKILANNGGIEYITSKSEPDFSKISPTFIKAIDQGVTNSNVGSSDATIMTYVAYADSYSFDEKTGLYSLNDPKIARYHDIYKELIGKYISSPYWSGDNTVPTTSLTNVYYVTDAESSAIYVKMSMKTLEQDLTDKGVYSTIDNDGTTYYFRGAVDNNWLYFAGFYWRIIRINGDGSIRLIYTGEKDKIDPTKGSISYYSVDTGITTSLNNPFSSNFGMAEYVGYMYQLGKAHGYKYDSQIKSTIDIWYYNNLLNYTTYLSDAGFCNDRTGYDSTLQNKLEGIGKTDVIYESTIRNYINHNPSLKCSNKEDNFTVQDTQKGNGALTYPIGLISVDEGAYAGLVFNTYNSYNYLNTGLESWTISPTKNETTGIYGLRTWMLGSTGAIVDNHSNNPYGSIRPVINLKSTVKVIGNGTASSPYIVVSVE